MGQSIKQFRLSVGLLAALAFAGNAGDAWAQDSETAEAAEDAPAVEAPADAADDEEVLVDDGSYIDAEEEDFRPSEEISSDQSITFPTDI